MELEAVRILADELDDGTNGVNALLASVPRDVTDQQPPNLVEVYDSSRTGWLARGELPEAMRDPAKCPFLCVSLLADIDFGGRSRPSANAGGLVAVELQLGVAYVTHESLTERAEQDGLYTLRAVRAVIQKLAEPGRAAARQRNKVQLELLKSVRQLRGIDPVEDKVVVAGAIVTVWTAREVSW